MIYLTRHGQSMTNTDKDLTSKFPLTVKNNVLTHVGVKQALDFGEMLRVQDADVTQIICSPYARTKQTAFLIATALGTCAPISYNRKFREIDWKIAGRWHRLLEKDPTFDHRNMQIDHKPMVDHRRRAYSLESPLEVYERVVPEFVRVFEKHSTGDLLLVSHYFVVKALNAFITAGSPHAINDYDPKNLCQLSWTDDQVREAIAHWRTTL